MMYEAIATNLDNGGFHKAVEIMKQRGITPDDMSDIYIYMADDGNNPVLHPALGTHTEIKWLGNGEYCFFYGGYISENTDLELLKTFGVEFIAYYANINHYLVHKSGTIPNGGE